MISNAQVVRGPQLQLRAYAWVSMLFFMGALTHVMGGSEGEPGPASFLYQPIAAAIYLVAGAYLFCAPGYRRNLGSYLLHDKWMTLSLLIVLASTFWSIDTTLTARKSIAVLATTFVGLLIGFAYSRSELVPFLRRLYLVFVIASVLVSILLPQYGVHQGGDEHAGRWRGLMSFKNQMAWTTVLFLIVWIAPLKIREIARPINLFGLGMGMLLLLMCGSATGILQLACGLVAWISLQSYFSSRRLRILLLMAGALGLCAVVLSANFLISSFLESSGRTETLSGRTVIWAEVWPFILQRPWLGWGQNAFWSDATRFFGNSFWVGSRNHSHNAYIEVLIDLGVTGLAAQMMFIVSLIRRLWRLGKSGDPEAATLLSLVVSLLVTGLAGALFFRANTGTWVLISAISGYSFIRNVNAPGNTRTTMDY